MPKSLKISPRDKRAPGVNRTPDIPVKANGIDADVQQCKVSEISSKGEIDLVVTTTVYENPDVPVFRALSFLTGIGVEEDITKIIQILNK